MVIAQAIDLALTTAQTRMDILNIWFHASFARVLRRHKKADLADRLKCLNLIRKYGRDGVIRTLDP
jgi:hypothetical protein